MKDPVLILQMLRMGDLILSFPLFLWLQRLHPEHPLWVVGSPTFFRDLLPVSPQVTYFPWTDSEALARRKYFRVINISHLPQAAVLAGKVKAEEKLGPLRQGRHTYIKGDWQLYRASLTGNNRHNRFHWADLNGLDAVPARDMGATGWPLPRALPVSNTNVGLFLGASEARKRPTAAFWAGLVRALLERDLLPILFGGPAERELGARVAVLSGRKPLNLCGRLGLAELAKVGQTLQLLITPDTGPMHLAAWTGVKVLNLSMGPVNPWETGPYQPGHYVLSPSGSCRGCWSCTRKGSPCRSRFVPGRVAALAADIISSRHKGGGVQRPTGVSLFRTGRDRHGLYGLDRVDPLPENGREAVGRFWQAFWSARFGLLSEGASPASEFARIRQLRPELAARFAVALARFGVVLSRARHSPLEVAAERFWHAHPPLLRPLTGYLQQFLQNSDHSEASFRSGLDLIEGLIALVDDR